jgi:chorismate mutase/prephenate dehydratase
MAKSKSKAKTDNAGASATDLPRQLERLDRELVALANQRARCATQLAAGRFAVSVSAAPEAEAKRPAVDFAAEEAQVAAALAGAEGPLSIETLRAILRELQSGCRALVKHTRVAFLGPLYSYSHQAANSYFGSTIELIPVGTIAAVFGELTRGHADFGLVPLENSTDGRVADTLDMFTRFPIRIRGEVPLRIHHNLMAKCSRNEVTEVYSKPQALSQCREWLSKQLPGARLVEITSTAAAAQVAVDKPGAAAVASRQAATHYGLNIVAANIEDKANNLTRFAVIGGADVPKRTGHDKTAIMFELPHRPGALADAMLAFKKNRLNLTWIESFPSPAAPNEYLFFAEFEGHQADAAPRRAIEALRRRCVRLEILGSYPRGTVIE